MSRAVRRAIAALLKPRRDPNIIAAERTAWLIEARPFNREGGEPASIPEGPPVCGSGVVVRIEHLQRTADGGADAWKSAVPADIRRYLLTCAHVVRGSKPNNAGWYPVLGEILCWRADSRYLHWPVRDRPRRSGEIEAIGAHSARVKTGPIPNDGEVLAEDATALNDWVLLEVDDRTSTSFDQVPAVDSWASHQDESTSGEFCLVGFPGAAIEWTHDQAVTAHCSEGFKVKRTRSDGAVILAGPDESRAGMSGGGVFDDEGRLVGIHRGAHDLQLERQFVPADEIRRWLEEHGMRPAPAPARALTPSQKVRRAGLAAGAVAVCVAVAAYFLRVPEADLCVTVTGAEKPLQFQPVAGLRMSLVPDGWNLPDSATATSDAAGKACFRLKLPRQLRSAERLPFNIRCDNAPAPLAELAPLFVEQYGTTNDGLRFHTANLRHYLDAEEMLMQLNVWSEGTRLASRLTGRVASDTRGDPAPGPPQNESRRIATAATELGFTSEQSSRGLEGWANLLKSERPVVPVAQLAVPDARLLSRVASGVGAYVEDGQVKATGFVVSKNAVLLPAFAISEHARDRRISFTDSVTNLSHAVRLGQTLWTSPEGTPERLSVSVVRALDRLPEGPALSDAGILQVQGGRPLYVIGYPHRTGNTPPELASLFSFGTRSVMFGESLQLPGGDDHLEHDATTLAGTAGGPVVDRATNAVIGVHLGGQFTGLTKNNFAASLGALLRDRSFRAAIDASGSLHTVSLKGVPERRVDPLALATTRPRTSGYNAAFLGPHIPLPVPTRGQPGRALDYLHYTIVMNEQRRTARIAAANIDRDTFTRVQRTPDVWHVDPRLGRDEQPSQELFANNALDRGNLIARSMLTWGTPDTAKIGSLSAFYWTNATPQHSYFNQRTWARLERRALDDLEPTSTRLSYFAGPIEAADDVEYRDYRIPRRFWMVAVYQNPDAPARPRVHAFIAEQYAKGSGPDPDQWPKGFDVTKEVSVAEVEREAGLKFQIPGIAAR